MGTLGRWVTTKQRILCCSFQMITCLAFEVVKIRGLLIHSEQFLPDSHKDLRSDTGELWIATKYINDSPR